MTKFCQQKKISFCSQQLFLRSSLGHEIELCRLGAAIGRISWPSPDGKVKNIALASQDSGDYAGMTLGPVAGRLAGAILPIGDEILPLSPNDGVNILHGGEHNLSRQLWALTGSGEGEDCAWTELSCSLAHGLDGFPGNRHFTARYVLSGDALTLWYTAETDRPTLVSMSNHTYWNLSGNFTSSSYNHLLELRADGVLYNNEEHLPFALRPCVGTAFDFFAPVSLKEAMARATYQVGRTPLDCDKGQLENAQGYNNGFALTSGAPFAARLSDPGSGLRMTMTTDQPYLVVYSGGYLSTPGCALALEAQGKPGATAPLLLPGQTYRRFITFSFDAI